MHNDAPLKVFLDCGKHIELKFYFILFFIVVFGYTFFQLYCGYFGYLGA